MDLGKGCSDGSDGADKKAQGSKGSDSTAKVRCALCEKHERCGKLKCGMRFGKASAQHSKDKARPGVTWDG